VCEEESSDLSAPSKKKIKKKNEKKASHSIVKEGNNRLNVFPKASMSPY